MKAKRQTKWYDVRHFKRITIEPLLVTNATAEEFLSFLMEAMEILDISSELRDILEGWCDDHAP